MKGAVIALALLVPTMASAEIYKCTGQDGKINLTDKPCAAGQGAERVVIPPAPETPYQKLMRESAEKKVEHEKEMADIRARAEKFRSETSSRNWDRKARKGLAIGMTSAQVVATPAWGSPYDTNVTETAAGRSEQWIYRVDIDNEYERMYLYFRNGVLVGIQD